MTPSSLPPLKPTPSWRTMFTAAIKDMSNVPDHPVQIALRTYSLCLSLSLGPVLLPVISALPVGPESLKTRASIFWRALSRELHPTGFASAMTIAVAGGAALQRSWDVLGRRYTHHRAWLCYVRSRLQRAFLANAITSALAVILLRWKKHSRSSPTVDLSFLLLVRALDASVQAFLVQTSRKIAARQPGRNGATSTLPDTRALDKQSEELAKEWKNKVVMRLDAFVFWVSSARIMWCFFYQPQRLPRSYLKWINSLANVDKRLLEVLRAIRDGKWSYIHASSTKRDILAPLAKKLGGSASWGDPTVLPAYGSDYANEVWRRLGVNGRSGVGGLPCELVHDGIGARFGLSSSCTANAVIRAVYAFAEALVIYLPVHFLPLLLTRPSSIMRSRRALFALLSATRSATFLSAFLSSFWFAVCFTRTLVLARLFPQTSHDMWDGPSGGILAGSLVCGASIWIENAKRRGEMALYVLPKALRTAIPEKWLRSRHPVIQFAECTTFVLSLALLLTFSVHQPESLRGLSRWTLALVMNGPNAGFWKKRRTDCFVSCQPQHRDPFGCSAASSECTSTVLKSEDALETDLISLPFIPRDSELKRYHDSVCDMNVPAVPTYLVSGEMRTDMQQSNFAMDVDVELELEAGPRAM